MISVKKFSEKIALAQKLLMALGGTYNEILARRLIEMLGKVMDIVFINIEHHRRWCEHQRVPLSGEGWIRWLDGERAYSFGRRYDRHAERCKGC